ncbi:16S rRNA (guanine(527)-N(7))-methyltransferase RsmG [Thermodesulfovibrio thiophilus]|uniref:16S rRNA (guanine(527)-N(7))-methyltransferase RsmG n=1 Tax=Thermodesulfovibrio thiophilus TaxID=340095 RepID=UPI00179085B6|nr:16S rRNA (guanine(527)-N(7))-methyltransferase RsmG [Thermodesulfovibrio thiophilus]
MQDLKEFLKQSLNYIATLSVLSQNNQEKCFNNEILEKFIIYLNELKKWNKTYNLTSIEDDVAIIIKHFLDSLLYLCFIPEKQLSIADVGSGAGFPGVPIAIFRPDLKITLIEPSWKKSAFLKNIKNKLELKHVDIIQENAEVIREKFDIVVSRALWSIKDFVEKCSHLIKINGYFLISKSLKINEEMKKLPAYFETETNEFVLPVFNAKRFIVKLKK